MQTAKKFPIEGEASNSSTLSFFSTLTINAQTDQFSFTLDFERSESFPSHRFDCQDDWFYTDKRFAPPPVLQNAAHLQLELMERIGEGGTGTAYSARVSAPVPELSGSLPSELVVKFAKVDHCRNLAREAWVYDWLDSQSKPVVGVIVPRCFGFFTARLKEHASDFLASDKLPWSSDRWNYEDSESRADALQDDDGFSKVIKSSEPVSDDKITKERSRWNSWVHNPDDPLVAVLLLEKGGSIYSDIDDKDPVVQKDIRRICKDLALTGVAHNDFRMANLIRAPPTAKVCPRHKLAHKWYVIDFNRAWVIDLAGEPSLDDAMETLWLCMDYQSPYFYRWNPS